MKKIWVLGLVMLGFLAISCATQPEIKDAKNKKDKIPKGLKTETMLVYKLKEKDGKYEKDLDWQWVSKYDVNGNKIEYISYDDAGKVLDKTFYYYDGDGNLIERVWYGRMGVLRNRSLYTYEADGNEISVTYNYKGELKYKLFSYHNDKGNLVKTEEYDANGQLEEITIFKYDEKNNMIDNCTFDNSGILKRKWVDNYDNKGNLIERIIDDTDKKSTTKLIFNYDDKGNKIELLWHFINEYKEERNKTIYKYNDKGILTENNTYKIEHGSGKEIELPDGQTIYEYEFYPESSIANKKSGKSDKATIPGLIFIGSYTPLTGTKIAWIIDKTGREDLYLEGSTIGGYIIESIHRAKLILVDAKGELMILRLRPRPSDSSDSNNKINTIYFCTKVNPDNSPQEPYLVFTQADRKIYACFTTTGKLKGQQSVTVRLANPSKNQVIDVWVQTLDPNASYNAISLEKKIIWEKGSYVLELFSAPRATELFASGNFEIDD